MSSPTNHCGKIPRSDNDDNEDDGDGAAQVAILSGHHVSAGPAPPMGQESEPWWSAPTPRARSLSDYDMHVEPAQMPEQEYVPWGSAPTPRARSDDEDQDNYEAQEKAIPSAIPSAILTDHDIVAGSARTPDSDHDGQWEGQEEDEDGHNENAISSAVLSNHDMPAEATSTRSARSDDEDNDAIDSGSSRSLGTTDILAELTPSPLRATLQRLRRTDNDVHAEPAPPPGPDHEHEQRLWELEDEDGDKENDIQSGPVLSDHDMLAESAPGTMPIYEDNDADDVHSTTLSDYDYALDIIPPEDYNTLHNRR